MGYLTPLQRRGLALSGVAFSFCALIVSYFKGFVKRFSEKIPDFFHYLRYSPLLWLVSVPSHEPNRTLNGFSKRDRFQWLLVINPLLFLLSTVLGAFAAEVPLIDTLIISYLGRFVKGFFKVLENFSLTSIRGVPLLCTIIIAHQPNLVKYFFQ